MLLKEKFKTFYLRKKPSNAPWVYEHKQIFVQIKNNYGQLSKTEERRVCP